MSAMARYLYAISSGLDPDQVSGHTGLEGAPLEVILEGSLSAVVSDVPLSDYGQEALRRNLEDLEWLERVARTHDEVVNVAHAAAPTAPLSLATICLDDDSARELLRSRHDDLVSVLDRVRGAQEWSVKVLTHAAQQGDAPVADPEARPTTGADYLRRKREQAGRRAASAASAEQAAQDTYEALSRCSVAARRLAPQDPRLSGLAGTMVLNAAFLVEEDDEGFHRVLGELASSDAGHEVLVAGPWPPYSFATLDASS